METPLELYRQQLSTLPPCDPAFFADALNRYRAGDTSAAREISGRCLRLALVLGEDRARQLGAADVLDMIQEANRGLWKAVTTYAGNDLDDFLRFANDCIQEQLAAPA